MPLFALPLAPAAAEGLAWGLGGLTALLTGKSIAENKDNIVEGISDFGDRVGRGILRWSGAMSPTGLTMTPSIDQVTGRYIAVPDATRVSTPYVLTLLPEALNTSAGSRVMAARAASGSPSGTAGSTTRGRGRKPAAKPATPTTGTLGGSTAAPSPKPPQNDNDSTKVSRLGRAWLFVRNHPKTSIAVGATALYPTREWIIKPALNYAGPAAGNAVAYLTTGTTPLNIPSVAKDSTDLWYHGGTGKVMSPSLTRLGYAADYLETDATLELPTVLRDTAVVSTSPTVLTDTSRVQSPGFVFVRR